MGNQEDDVSEVKRYRFDRFGMGGKPLAEGIVVHAENMIEANIKAEYLMGNDTVRIRFSDNGKCAKTSGVFGGSNCSICYPTEIKRRK